MTHIQVKSVVSFHNVLSSRDSMISSGMFDSFAYLRFRIGVMVILYTDDELEEFTYSNIAKF